MLDVYGQWQSKPAQGQQPHPQRIRSKPLIIDYPNTPENAARIEAIRAAWKRQAGDQSVLKVTSPPTSPSPCIIGLGSKEAVMQEFDRITQNPFVMGGKACIRGMRVTVSMIVGQIGCGQTIDELLADFPYIEREDVMQALQYAARGVADGQIDLAAY